MFLRRYSHEPGLPAGLVNFGFLIWALTVRALREASGGAALGVLRGILLAGGFCLGFYVFVRFFQLRGVAVRGDLMVFILIGVGFFFVMKSAMMAAMKAMSGSWALCAHPHLSPVLFVYAETLAVLYNWTVAILAIWLANGLVKGSLALEEPILFFPIFLTCWLLGVGAGMALAWLEFTLPWFAPVKRVLFKLLFFTSGKFANANILPADMLALFTWNPLFHLIDQMRDAAFVNYTALKTNMTYPLAVTFALVVIGHMLHDDMLRRRNVMSG